MRGSVFYRRLGIWTIFGFESKCQLLKLALLKAAETLCVMLKRQTLTDKTEIKYDK